MSTGVAEPDTHIDESVLEAHDFEIACELGGMPEHHGTGFRCLGEKAVWCGWRTCPCESSPSYVLACDPCKKENDRRIVNGWAFVCGWCGATCDPMVFMPMGDS